MEEVFADCVAERATPARPCCCPATSSARSSGSPTGSRSSARAAPSRPARSPSCATCAAAGCAPRSTRPPDGLDATCPASTTSTVDGARVACTVDPDALTSVLAALRRLRRPLAHQRAAHARGAVPATPTGDAGPASTSEAPSPGRDRLPAHGAAPRPGAAASVWVGAARLVVYASAAATATLYPDAGRPGRGRRGHQRQRRPSSRSTGRSSTCSSLGELAMTKLTVLYAVVRGAAVRRPRPPAHPARGGVRPRRAARRHRGRPRRPARRRAGRGGAAPAGHRALGGRRRRGRRAYPSAGSLAFGREPGRGIGLVATG